MNGPFHQSPRSSVAHSLEGAVLPPIEPLDYAAGEGEFRPLRSMASPALMDRISALTARRDLRELSGCRTRNETFERWMDHGVAIRTPSQTDIVLLPSLDPGREEILRMSKDLGTEVLGGIGAIRVDRARAIILTRYILPAHELILTLDQISDEPTQGYVLLRCALRQHARMLCEVDRALRHLPGDHPFQNLSAIERLRKIADLSYPHPDSNSFVEGLAAEIGGYQSYIWDGKFSSDLWSDLSKAAKAATSAFTPFDSRTRSMLGIQEHGGLSAAKARDLFARMIKTPWMQIASPSSVSDCELFMDLAAREASARNEGVVWVHTHPLVPQVPGWGEKLLEQRIAFDDRKIVAEIEHRGLESIAREGAAACDREIARFRAVSARWKRLERRIADCPTTDQAKKIFERTRNPEIQRSTFFLRAPDRFRGSERRAIGFLRDELRERASRYGIEYIERTRALRERVIDLPKSGSNSAQQILIDLIRPDGDRQGTFAESDADSRNLAPRIGSMNAEEPRDEWISVIDNPLGTVIATRSRSNGRTAVHYRGAITGSYGIQEWKTGSIIADRWRLEGSALPVACSGDEVHGELNRPPLAFVRELETGRHGILFPHYLVERGAPEHVDYYRMLDAVYTAHRGALPTERFRIGEDAATLFLLPEGRILAPDEWRTLRKRLSQALPEADDRHQALCDLRWVYGLGRIAAQSTERLKLWQRTIESDLTRVEQSANFRQSTRPEFLCSLESKLYSRFSDLELLHVHTDFLREALQKGSGKLSVSGMEALLIRTLDFRYNPDREARNGQFEEHRRGREKIDRLILEIAERESYRQPKDLNRS